MHIQEIGCLVGALSNLWVGDRLGRRRTIVLGGVVMIVGAILQATAFSYAHILVARVITGLGNGLNVRFHFMDFDNRTADIHHFKCHRLRLSRHTTQNARQQLVEGV